MAMLGRIGDSGRFVCVDPNQAVKIRCGTAIAADAAAQRNERKNKVTGLARASAGFRSVTNEWSRNNDVQFVMLLQRRCIRGPLIQINGAAGWSCRLLSQEMKEWEIVMKQVGLKAMLAATVIVCGVSGSVGWSHDNGLSLSVEGAQARVGRPLTPVSVAGVARRTTRRAVVGGAAVGAAVAAPACIRVLVNGRYVCR